MDIADLKPGDRVLVEATVVKAVDDGEGEPPVVLLSIDHAHQAINGPVSVLVIGDIISSRIGSQAPPDTPPANLAGLDRQVDHIPT